MSRMFGVMFLLASLGLAAADIFWGFWDHDAGFYFNQSAMMADGLRPFIDFVTIYPPLFAGLHAIVLASGADRWTMVWAIPFFWILANAVLTGLYLAGDASGPRAWKQMRPWLGGGAFCLLCIDSGGNHNTLEHGVVFFGLLSLLAMRARESWRFLGVGAAVACAALSKQVGILLLLPYLTQIRNWKQAVLLAAGLALPTVACLLWLEFDFAAVQRSADKLASYLGASGEAPLWTLLAKFVSAYFWDMARAPWIVVFLLVLLLLGVTSLKSLLEQHLHREAAWLASWIAVAILYLAARGKNNFPHYTINCWPALVAIVAVAPKAVGFEVYKRFLGAGLAASLALTALFSARLTTLDGKPYFTRWSHGGTIFVLKRVAEELDEILPPTVSITQLGMEESIILFLGGRLPRNKDWSGHEIVGPVAGDGILLTDYGQPSAGTVRAEIERAGFRLHKEWPARGLGKIQFFWR